MSLSKKDSEFYLKKAIKITRYLMFYYLLTSLSAFANLGLNFGAIIKLFFVILLFQVQYNVRWYSSISVGALGFFVFTQIAAFGAMILSLIRSVSYLGFSRFDSSILMGLFFRLFILAYGGLGFYYALKAMQIKNEKNKVYGTLDEDEIGNQ
jgi:hypothetical protein